MGMPRFLLPLLAKQLSQPRGPLGRLVARELDKSNRDTITAAIDAIAPRPGESVADVGFGGGVGLALLLDRVGANGRVHGIDISPVALSRAARRFRDATASGRLALYRAPIDNIPLADASIDALLTINTIYFVADLGPAFAELARVLTRSGRLVIGLADPDAMATEPVTQHGFTLRAVADVTATLAAVGLRVEHRRTTAGEHAFHLLLARPSGRS
jgi:arsenite methyltransferase